MIDAVGAYMGLDFGGDDKEYYPEQMKNTLIELM